MRRGPKLPSAQLTDDNLRFAGQGKIIYIHVRNVRGRSPRFDEGEVDTIAVLKAHRDAGYEGVITRDHTPRVVGDTWYGHRRRAFALGHGRASYHVRGEGLPRVASSGLPPEASGARPGQPAPHPTHSSWWPGPSWPMA